MNVPTIAKDVLSGSVGGAVGNEEQGGIGNFLRRGHPVFERPPHLTKSTAHSRVRASTPPFAAA